MDARKFETYFFVVLLLAVFILGWALILPYLSTLIFAGTLALVCQPVYRLFVRAFRGHKTIAAIILLILVLIVVLIPLTFFAFQMVGEAQNLLSGNTTGKIPVLTQIQFFKDIADFSPKNVARLLEGQRVNFQQYITAFIDWIGANIGSIFSGFLGFLLNLVIGLMAFYYFLKDGDKFRAAIIRGSPLGEVNTERILDRLTQTIGSVVKGTVIIALVQGVLAGVGFGFCGLSNPALWGLATMVASLVPTFGTAITTVPAVIYLFFTGNVFGALGAAVWGIFVVAQSDTFLRGKLIGRGMPIHPFLILLAVFGGLELFGPIGFLMGPLVLSFLFALFEIFPEIIKGNRVASPISHKAPAGHGRV